MSGQPTLQPEMGPLSRVSATHLLELFSQTPHSSDRIAHSPNHEAACLWRTDAIHRAKNLAQMAVSLADVAEHPSRQWLRPEIAAQVRSLARAYDALAEDHGDPRHVPCAALLIEIVSRLTDIFGRRRGISAKLDVQPFLVSPAFRRGLILVCSELIINALKYAFPSNQGGVIRVRLFKDQSRVLLIVEDDGVGASEGSSIGAGTGLIDQLCAAVGATLTRAPGEDGRGLRVVINTPLR